MSTDEALTPEQDPNKPLPAKTTNQEDIAKAGQRTINLIWETTQSRIALLVVCIGLGVNGIGVMAVLVFDRDISANRLAVISVCLQFINLTAGIVIGFYFSRTNHTNVGGIGPRKTDQER